MLANIIICPGLLIDIVTLEAAIRRMFSIDSPTHTLRFQEVNYCLLTWTNSCKTISNDSICGSTDGGDIIALRWMGYRKVISQKLSLGREPGKIRWQRYKLAWQTNGEKLTVSSWNWIVCVFAPYRYKAVECLSSNVTCWALCQCCCPGLFHCWSCRRCVLSLGDNSPNQGDHHEWRPHTLFFNACDDMMYTQKSRSESTLSKHSSNT